MAFSRILEEKTLQALFEIYCRKGRRAFLGGTFKPKELCDECGILLRYALERLEKCPHQDQKPVCSKCKVHCYQPEMRAKIIQVMRYSGPRLLFRSPILSIRYLYRKLFKNNGKCKGKLT